MLNSVVSILNFNNFKLVNKLTFIILLVFVLGSIISGLALSALLNRNAQNEITSKALMLMETMNSVRTFTNTKVKPELEKELELKFIPASVPAYSAREIFETFRKEGGYVDFLYKEAALNPTNPRDLADDFEKNLIEQFRQNNNSKELEGFISTNKENLFYIARPFKITKPACLECHSIPDLAPKTMVQRYGKEAGFGWKMQEIVGAQIIYIPASKVLKDARESLVFTMGIVIGIFALAVFLVNLWLRKFVVTPLTRMAQVAEVISKGNLNAEFQKLSNDEVGILAEAFMRMKTSFAIAMKRLDNQSKKNRPDLL
jgi:methyl-accepting chemotaxis protein